MAALSSAKGCRAIRRLTLSSTMANAFLAYARPAMATGQQLTAQVMNPTSGVFWSYPLCRGLNLVRIPLRTVSFTSRYAVASRNKDMRIFRDGVGRARKTLKQFQQINAKTSNIRK